MKIIIPNIKSIPTLIFLCLVTSFVAGNFYINLFLIIATLFTVFTIFQRKLKIQNIDFVLLFFFFTLIIFSSFFKDFNFKNFYLIKFLGLSMFGYFFKEELIKNNGIIYSFLILIVAFLSIDIIFQNFFEKNIIGLTKYQNIIPTGFFGDEKISGSYLSIVTILFSTIFLINKKSNSKHTLFMFIFILSLISIILSTQRKAQVDILIFIGLILFLFPHKKTFLTVSIFVIFFISFINIFPTAKVSLFQKTFMQFGIFKDNTNKNLEIEECTDDFQTNCYRYYGINRESSLKNNQYYAHYLTSLNIWRDFPIFGAGNKKFREYCSDKKYEIKNNVYSDSRCSTHPHNIYLTVLSEHGIIGLITFLTLILRILFNRDNYNQKDFKLFMFPLFLVLIIPLPTGNIFSTWLGSFFWLSLGFLLKKKK